MTADGIYKMVKHYAERVGVNIEGFGAHSLRATAATNALDHEADIAKVHSCETLIGAAIYRFRFRLAFRRTSWRLTFG